MKLPIQTNPIDRRLPGTVEIAHIIGIHPAAAAGDCYLNWRLDNYGGSQYDSIVRNVTQEACCTTHKEFTPEGSDNYWKSGLMGLSCESYAGLAQHYGF